MQPKASARKRPLQKHPQRPDMLGQFEEVVLMAILHLGSNAYGVTILQEIEERTEKSVTVGALYTTLDRLESKGYVSSRLGDPTPERGGRAKRYFQIQGLGEKALNESERVRRQMREGLEPILGTT